MLTRSDVLTSGFTDGFIRSRIERGEWEPANAGVYVVRAAADAFTPTTVAVVAAGPRAVASHFTAAALWRIGGIELPRSPYLTVPNDRRPSVAGAVLHRAGDLRRRDVARRERIPVTSPARTLADLGRYLDPDRLERCMVDAVVQRITSVAQLERMAARRLWGMSCFREVLRNLHPQVEDVASWLEWMLLDLCERYQLPTPRVNRPVRDSTGRARKIDADFGRGVGVELDGYAYHASAEAKRADDARHNALMMRYRVLLRYSFRDLRDTPARVAEEIRSALAVGMSEG